MVKKRCEIMTYDYYGLIVTGLCTGLGSALGHYLSNRVLIKNIERLGNGINKDKQKGIDPLLKIE